MTDFQILCDSIS